MEAVIKMENKGHMILTERKKHWRECAAITDTERCSHLCIATLEFRLPYF